MKVKLFESVFSSRGSLLLTFLAFTLVASIMIIGAAADETAVINTDKMNYSPGETAVISGSNFPGSTTLVVQIFRPQGTDLFPIVTSPQGSFTLQYELTSERAMEGSYTVIVVNPHRTEILATTTFLDLIIIGPVSVTPDSELVFQGDSASYTVTVERSQLCQNIPLCLNFAFYADLMIPSGSSTLPGDVTILFSPEPILFGSRQNTSTSTLTIATTETTSVGSYDFKVRALWTPFDGIPFDWSTSSLKTLVVVPKPSVTSSSLCTFDTNPLPGQQFRLRFNQDHELTTYGLRASNPGQFYYNVFTGGLPGDPVNLDINVPYPFVTQGSVPIQIHSGINTPSAGCFMPSGDDLTGSFTITGTTTTTPAGALGISLGDYGATPVVGVTTLTIHISGTVPSTGLVYVTMHLDYDLKKTDGYVKDGDNDAIGTPSTTIPNLQTYGFSVTGDITYTRTIQSENDF